MARDAIEQLLAQHLTDAGIPFEREYTFARALGRRWRADFLLTGRDILIECEGGVWLDSPGRHTRASGFVGDIAKYNHAAALGFRLLRFTTDQVKNGQAIGFIQRVLAGAGGNY